MITNLYIHHFQIISEAECKVLKQMAATGNPILILVDSSDLCFKEDAPLTLKTRIDALTHLLKEEDIHNVHIGHVQHYELTCPEEFDGYAMHYDEKVSMWVKHFELPTKLLMWTDEIEDFETTFALASHLEANIQLVTNTSHIRNLTSKKQIEFWYDAMENKEVTWEAYTPPCLHWMKEAFLHDRIMTQRV